MEYYEIFLKVIQREIKRFNLDPEEYSISATQLTAALNENFDVPYYRCAYMYRFATINVFFFKDCITQFLLEYPNIRDIISAWKCHSEVKVCSLSIGPGLDYLAFILAMLEYEPLPPNFNGVKVISKSGAWRNTVNFITEVIREQKLVRGFMWPRLKYVNVDIIQADLLKSYSGNSKLISMSEAHVVLMMKTLNLSAAGTPEEGPLLKMLKELISTLRSDAIIFCIDTKPSIALLTEALVNSPGKYLHGPIHLTAKLEVEFPVVKCRPVVSARGTFLVWQKLSAFPTMAKSFESLEITPTNSECKKNPTISCSGNKSSWSVSSTEIEAKVSDAWKEWQTCLQNAGIETLKSLSISNNKSTENQLIDEVSKLSLIEHSLGNSDTSINQLGKVDIGQKPLLNISKFKEFDDFCAKHENTIKDDSLYAPLQSDFVSDASSFSYKSSFTCDPGLQDMDSSVQGVTNGHMALSKEVEVNPATLTHLSKNGYQSPVKSSSIIKKENKSREATFFKSNNTVKSPQENKLIQTDRPDNISLDTDVHSVKALTERIRQLVTSLESIANQNAPHDSNEANFNGPHNNCYYQEMQNCVSDSYTCNNVGPACSRHFPDNHCLAVRKFSRNEVCSGQKSVYPQCSASEIRCQCCHTCSMSHHGCLKQCHFQLCHVQPVPKCQILPCVPPHKECCSSVNSTSSNIVIPLQNVSDDVLLQIASVLKTGYKSD